MGATVDVSSTTNASDVLFVMTHPDIWDVVAEDGVYKDDFKPDFDNNKWFVLSVGGVLIGLLHAHSQNGITMQCHIAMLPQYRKQHSKNAGISILQYIYDNFDNCDKIVALVPDIYPNVKNFLTSFGFVLEGVNRLSYRKYGRTHDQSWFGITRDEIKKVLNG